MHWPGLHWRGVVGESLIGSRLGCLTCPYNRLKVIKEAWTLATRKSAGVHASFVWGMLCVWSLKRVLWRSEEIIPALDFIVCIFEGNRTAWIAFILLGCARVRWASCVGIDQKRNEQSDD